MKLTVDPLSLSNSNVENTSETTWIITLEEDPVTGDLIMPLPNELLESQGWKIGDTLIWDFEPNTNAAILKKA